MLLIAKQSVFNKDKQCLDLMTVYNINYITCFMQKAFQTGECS